MNPLTTLARRRLVPLLVVALGMAGSASVLVLGTANAANPPVTLTPTSGPPGTAITVQLPSACGSASGPAHLYLSAESVVGAAAFPGVNVAVPTNAPVTQGVLDAPASSPAGSYLVNAYCQPDVDPPTSYGQATFLVTDGSPLPPLTVTPTSGTIGTVIDVAAPCAPATGQPTASLSVVLFSPTQPDQIAYGSNSGVGPTLHAEVTVPFGFPIGDAKVAASCFDYLSTSTFAESTFAVAAAAPSALSVNDLDHGVTPSQLVESLTGGGLASISNVTYTGANGAAGAFADTGTAVGFGAGVVLGSGSVQTTSSSSSCSRGVEGPNTCPGNTTDYGTSGDADLTALANVTTNDASVLEFDFVPQFSTVQFDYVFASDEYNEFANSPFNDVFGFFVNGVNCATVGTDPAVPVSVNTINGGNPLGTDAHHPELYRDNSAGALDTEMDGLTTVLHCNALVTPNATNHMKLAIADGSDGSLDSNVFIEAGSLVSGSSITGSLSDGTQHGATITVPAGTPVVASSALSGVTAATATGTVHYRFTTGASCDTVIADGGTKTVTAGTVPDSDPVTLPAGTYSMVASYSGDVGHNASSIGCGDVQLTVTGTGGALTVSLTPTTDSVMVGTNHLFTAAVTQDSAPQAGLPVIFAVISGPNAGILGGGITDADGHVTFGFASSSTGTDVMRSAAFVGSVATISNDASVTWTQPPSGLGVTGSTSPPTITSGSTGRVHFVIDNPGPGSAEGVYAVVSVPAEATPIGASSSQGGCTAFVGNQAICLIGSIPEGGNASIDVLVRANNASVGANLPVTITVHSTGKDPVGVDAGPAVIAASPDEAIGFVGPSQTISTGTDATPANPTVASFRMPSKSQGAPITLRLETAGVGTFCGSQPCNGKIIFLSPFEGVNNPRSPARLKLTWDKSIAGRGTKSQIYVQKQPDGPITVVPTCDNTDKHIAIPSPCIHEKEKLDNGDIMFEIVLLSGDPRFARR
ncbi:MAG: choice-of-anchor L domain-containing protein [Acidimicrobiia bacterium]